MQFGGLEMNKEIFRPLALLSICFLFASCSKPERVPTFYVVEAERSADTAAYDRRLSEGYLEEVRRNRAEIEQRLSDIKQAAVAVEAKDAECKLRASEYRLKSR